MEEYWADVCLEDMCPVCGDKVSGYHYGLLTCESCKGFFKRTVQNNKKYICAEYQGCTIDKSRRKRCPFCRFQKCLYVGMRLEAVRADRMRGGRNKFGPMYKRDRALKQQRRALIETSKIRIESPTPCRNVNFTVGLHPVNLVFHSIPEQNISHLPLCPLPPPHSTSATQHKSNATLEWTTKSEPRLRSQDPRVPQLLADLLHCEPNDLELQSKIGTFLLQEQLGWTQDRGEGSPGTFRLMCLMADQTLITIVEWARASIFFRQLKVSDQMRLLHSCWSDLLLLDVISRQVLRGKEGRILLVTGQEVELSHLLCHAGPALASLVQRGKELVEKLDILKVDRQEFACMKFLTVFNPDVKHLDDQLFIESVQEQVEGALLEYTLHTSSHLLGRFPNLLHCLSELHFLGGLAEDYLHLKHLSGEVPCNNLLLEMLYAKSGWP